jgi:hypothetical protein
MRHLRNAFLCQSMGESTDNEHVARQQPMPLPSNRPANNGLRLATIDHSDVAAEGGVPDVETRAQDDNEKDAPVTWMSLPHKRQLVILTLARLSEPLVQTSLQVCLYAFNPPLSPVLANGLGLAGIYVLSAQVF